MSTTGKIGLQLLANGAGNQTLANQTFTRLDQLINAGVVDKDLSAPPGSPADGALYIIASSPTGAWSGKAKQLAYWLGSAWNFIPPLEGFRVRVLDEHAFYYYDGSAWTIEASGGGGGMTNPMTAAADLIVGGSGGSPTRLAVGTNGFVLTVVAGAVAWAAASGGSSGFPPGVLSNNNTSYTLVIGDANSHIRMTNNGAVSVTIPPESAVAWAANTEVTLEIAGSGGLTVAAGVGVTIIRPNGQPLSSGRQYSQFRLKKVATDTWLLDFANMFNPMTVAGDMIYASTATPPAPVALPIGSNGQYLSVVSGLPSWVTLSAMTNPMTTVGDLIIGGSSGTPTRLAAGTNGFVLTMVSGSPAWAAASGGGMTNPMTTLNDLIVGGASGTPTRLAVGTSGQYLTYNGSAVVWGTFAGMTNPMTTQYDIIVAGSGGTPSRLARGNESEILTVRNNAVVYGGYTPALNVIAGTAYTLALADNGKALGCTNASAVTITIPHSSTVNFLVNSEIDIYQNGAGVVTIAPAASVTLRVLSTKGTSTLGQYAKVTIKRIAANEWVLTGDC